MEHGKRREEESAQTSRPAKNRRLEHLWKPINLMSIEARIEFAVEAEGFRSSKADGGRKGMSTEVKERPCQAIGSLEKGKLEKISIAQ